MALEKSLWGRLFRAQKAMKAEKVQIHLERIENEVAAGGPDVDGCIEGALFKMELKSCERPVRESTPIRPTLRPKQIEWHADRAAAGSRFHWVLIQVGDGKQAKLYLIPGKFFTKVDLHCPESDLELISVCEPTATPADVLIRAMQGW